MKKIKQGLSLMSHNRAPLLTSDFIFECVKILRRNFCLQGPNFKRKFHAILELALRERAVTHPPSKTEGIEDTGHTIGMVLDARKSVFGSQQLLKLHILFIMTLH